jgi:hypothetical protein
LRQWRQPVRHTDLWRALRDERALITIGRAEIALLDLSSSETHHLYQQRAGRLCAAHHVEDPETGGGDALQPGAVIDVDSIGAARQARMALQVEQVL